MTEEADPLNIAHAEIQGYKIIRFCGSGNAGHVCEAQKNDGSFAFKVYKDWLFDADPEGQDARIASARPPFPGR